MFAFIVFGVYAQYDAEQTVMSVLERKKNELQNNNADIDARAATRDARFMERAIELSHVAHRHRDGAPFGSVVVKDGVIIGEGWNKVHVLNDPSAHAEVMAIRDASSKSSPSKLQGSVIYTSAQPCPMCLSLIQMTGIEKVFYCIPGERLGEIPTDLSAEQVETTHTTPDASRPVEQIPMLQESVSDLIKSYRSGERDARL